MPTTAQTPSREDDRDQTSPWIALASMFVGQRLDKWAAVGAYRVLMPQHQQLRILGHLTPGQHHQAAEHATREQIDDREDHPAISNPAGH